MRKLVLALAAASLVLTACTKKEDDSHLSVYYGSLSDDVKTFDPANAYDVVSLEVVPSVYETLYQYSYLQDPYRVEPLLAADMPKVSKDRLTVTIPIRTDVKFQDDPSFKAT